ncbi:MAG TPA: hypothetical protein QGH10_09145, partial [Armatimonadota bacterium]|nr:hypothetical protein [Armatimonadota bacterium]
HPGSAVGTPVTYPGSAVGTPVTYPGSAVGTPVTYPGTAIGSGPTLPSVAVLGDTGIRTGTGLSTLPTYPNLPTGYQVVGGYPTYPTTIPTIPITDPSSTAAIYKWPVIDGSGKVTTFATTEPTWGRTPALVAPAPGPTTLQPGQTLVQGPQGVHVLGDSSQRPTPLPTTSTTTPQPLPGGGTTPTPTIQPVIPQFGTTLTPTPTTAALPGADGDIANARTLYLQDIARYAAACDAGLQAATGLSANPGLMNSQMTDAIRTFRTTAMDRHAQYDGDVYRAIRSAR